MLLDVSLRFLLELHLIPAIVQRNNGVLLNFRWIGIIWYVRRYVSYAQ
jgi:hypothetical protein